jgi:hypothetical protein
MDRFDLAERSICTRSRAEEIIGDLQEQSDSSSPHPGFAHLGFWLTICRILFRMGWRWILAVVAAFWSFALPLNIFLVYLARHIGPPHPPKLLWVRVFFSLMACSVFTFSSAVLSLVRFGRKGSLNWMALFLSALFLTAACFARFSAAILWAPLAAVLIVVGLLLYIPTRRPLVSVLAISGAQVAACALGFEFIYRIHSDSIWMTIGSWAMSIGTGAYVLSVIRKRTDEERITPQFD